MTRHEAVTLRTQHLQGKDIDLWQLAEAMTVIRQSAPSAPAGGVVLDVFFGSGTVGEVCQNLGRQWIGCELNRDYAPLQDARLSQQGLILEAA